MEERGHENAHKSLSRAHFSVDDAGWRMLRQQRGQGVHDAPLSRERCARERVYDPVPVGAVGFVKYRGVLRSDGLQQASAKFADELRKGDVIGFIKLGFFQCDNFVVNDRVHNGAPRKGD
ncbi:hypothetical protein HBIAX_03561 [Achromobacter xylosoxidans]|jgi:hypothetical protein|uniref:Uncharacterized protein n=1 Tax=Achromobacter insolitus TaxID=217204 RepID=A0A6S7FH93_9BURK|nr:hypothetical protein LMG26846_02396 [Achromobacter insuavis]CAB3936315.1 hypothetical protein LMG6000_04819 [Achromobacter insolitus]CKI20207.1 Uncharacterised protein [Achromobacter xylosoxidans]CUJ32879.1 Uncharacterised protein [Achromobacter sp. 2789STDY5608621]CAB3942135.1 hypothetical protein LMG5997_04808 [Achromobacter insolitus]